MLRHSALTRTIALLLCATACTTWRVQTAPPAETLSTPRERARLTLADGTAHDLHSTRIEGDRVVAGTFSSPLADVRRVELRQFSTGRTLGLAAGVVGGLVVFTILLHQAIQEDIDLSGSF